MPKNTTTPPPTAALDTPPAVPESRWALAPDTESLVDALRLHLDCHVTELRDRWSDKSERWQESDQGTEVDAWIEALGDLMDTLDNFDRQV